MAAATPNRLGQINGAGDEQALFLKVFAGEVLTAFRQNTVFLGKHIVRTLTSGKSAQFPATGRATSEIHTPGTELTGLAINQAERIITIDDMIVSHVFVAEIDEAMNHYDLRGEYAYQLGEALAQRFDKNVARVMGQAARSAATVTGLPAGTTIEAGTARSDADVLAGAIFDAALALDENKVPSSDRVCFLQPEQNYMLVESSSKAIHRDYAGEGSYAAGRIIRIAGIPMQMTTNLPITDESVAGGSAPDQTKYADDFSSTAALVTQRSAVGTVKLRDISVRSDYDFRRLGSLLVAKYLMGHGVLRPESAVEIREDQPANASA